MTMTAPPGRLPDGHLIADRARTLRDHAGPCAICSWALLAGQRAADLADHTGVAHLQCIVAATTPGS